jgi:uncharacterized damage-inducible protein DinB
MTSERERADMLESLARHRGFLRFTTRNLADAQASQRTTASALTLGGLIKHVAAVEQGWAAFASGGAEAMNAVIMASASRGGTWEDLFRMLPGETLEGLLDNYDAVAARTAEVVNSIADFDLDYALPDEPWFERGARWSVRRVLLHIIAETAQHAGHADIIREALDGQKTMG